MSEPAFPPHIAAALDRLTVPPLPPGFGERLAARIEAGDLPADTNADLPPLPAARRRFGTMGWRRSGRIVAVTAAFGIATATAAASGAFGDPVYVPVVSETLAKAQLVELPKRETAKPQPKPVAAKSETVEPPPLVPTVEPAKGRQAVRELYRRLRADPEFRQLPPRERTAVARRELEGMLARGEVTAPELRAAVAEYRAIQRERREQRLQSGQERSLPIPVPPREGPVGERPLQRPIVDPAKAEARREAYREMPAGQKARLRELREQLRTAPPAERPAIRREIRAIWQSMGQSAAEKIDAPGEGNPGPVR